VPARKKATASAASGVLTGDEKAAMKELAFGEGLPGPAAFLRLGPGLRGARRGARPGQDVDVGCAHRFAAVRAAQFDVADVAARVVPVKDGRPGAVVSPPVTPSDHYQEQVAEVGSTFG
jgi:hypothetical protein